MPAKKNTEPNGEQEEGRVVAPPPLEKRHNEARAERRALEIELAEIDGKIRSAIEAGDLVELDVLGIRKIELPRLFIAASTAETKARHDIFNVEDQANHKQLNAALADREKLQAKLEKRQEEFEAEITELKNQLAEAEGRVNVFYAAIAGSRNFGADQNAAFKKSLASLTGV